MRIAYRNFGKCCSVLFAAVIPDDLRHKINGCAKSHSQDGTQKRYLDLERPPRMPPK